jgi:hypothetical protein
VRGFSLQRNDPDLGARPLVRPAADDLFRVGAREAMHQVVADSAVVPTVTGRGDPAAIARAVAAVADPDVPLEVTGDQVVARGEPLRAGLVLGRLLAALAAEGLRAAWVTDAPPTLRVGPTG